MARRLYISAKQRWISQPRGDSADRSVRSVASSNAWERLTSSLR